MQTIIKFFSEFEIYFFHINFTRVIEEVPAYEKNKETTESSRTDMNVSPFDS